LTPWFVLEDAARVLSGRETLTPVQLPPHFQIAGRTLVVRALACCLGIMATAAWVSAVESGARKFDVPADLAEKSLRAFSVQSGSEVLFSSDAASGVRTNAIKGEFLPGEAVKKMLAGTTLYVRDERDGVFRIAATPRPKATGAALSPGPSDRPGEAKSGSRSRDPPPGTSSTAQPNQLQTSQPQHNESPPLKKHTFLSLFAGTAAIAQAAVPMPDQPIELSPFSVKADKDYGYTAANTLAGGRLSTELLKTPVSTSVMTRELLDDLGITDVQGALAWTTGALAAGDSDVNANAASGDSLNGRPTLGGNNNSVSLRGFSAVSVARNYFPWFVNSDGYNTERIDVSRGPNALIFGDASTGGIVNVTTKRAGGPPKREVQVRVSDEGQFRVAADYNQTMSKNLAVRVNLLRERSEGWRDFFQNDRDGIFLTTTITPWKNAQIRLEGEYGKTHRISPALYIRDVASGWNGTTTYAARLTGSTNPAAATGTARFDNTAALRNLPYLILDLGNQSAGFVDWQGWARTTGQGTPLEVGVPAAAGGLAGIPIQANAVIGQRGYRTVPDYAYAVRAAAYRATDEYHAFSAFYEQRLTQNLYLELAGTSQARDNVIYTPASHNQLYIDVNSNQPNGSANPSFLRPYISGTGYRPIATDQTIQEVRASLAYLADFDFTKQRIGAVVSQRMTETEQTQRWYVRTNGANPDVSNVANRLYFKAYLDGAGQSGAIWSNVGDTVTYADGTVAEYVPFLAGNSFSEGTVTTLQAFVNGSWFKGDRVHTILGLRSDSVDIDTSSPVYDAITSRLTGFTPNENVKRTVRSPSMGAVVEVTPWFVPYVNYSKTFSAPSGGSGAYDIFLNILPVKRGEGWDYGFKFNAFQGRVVGSLGYYRTEEQNTAVIDSTLADRINSLNTLVGRTTELVQRAYSDTQDTKATGYELDITANLTRSWSLMLNAALPESAVANSLPRYVAVVAQNRAAWTAAASNSGNPDAALMQQYLSDIDGRFALRADGLPIVGTIDYIAKIFTRYRFTQRTLKGVFIGGGATMQGEILRGEINGQKIYSKGFTTYSALAGYARKIGKVNLKTQVNVSNVLDSLQFRYTAYDAAGLARQFQVATPRTISLTFSAEF